MSTPIDRPTHRPAGRGRAERPLDIPARLPVRACGPATDQTADHHTLLAEILALHDALAAAPSLEPGPGTDALFTRLVGLAVAPRPGHVVEAVLDDPELAGRLPDLRARCADGEYALERSWARRVLAAPDPAAELEGFPYLQNYRDLTRIEYHAVAGHAPLAPRRALFVGSGPLPLSALLLARHGVTVDAVDVDPEAVALGGAVARALGDDVTVSHGDVLGLDDLAGYDLVCVAALVGLAPDDKAAALAHVRSRMRPGATVLARSAHSLRGLLYPVLDVAGDDPDGLGGLEPLAVLHPHTDVVNSVVLARVPG
ncbi:nicotianamine synthase family protein [Actinomycetospora aeridis]|uniref:Nicotianamine synthase family protein n=1 Tax=Actinomycetospora aeridis TaxID=3129231 RepID=A0ABU8N467_9PSEU